MATYNLQRLSVLIVEDNEYIRKVLADLLTHLTVGRVTTAKNGAEAAEILKGQIIAGVPSGGLDPDIIISDMIMSPIDGQLLLRWVRNGKDSPNRFAPFIMMSGAADDEHVQQSRRNGGTEFLAKPFSAESVARQLLQAIDRPRQFVLTHDYFGPDRQRRQVASMPGDERRVFLEQDAHIVHSDYNMVRPKEAGEVWFFRLPNVMQEKVSMFGGGGSGELPNKLLMEAELQLRREALEFHQWAQDYLAELSRLCQEALETDGPRKKQFDEINHLAHELRGQGGTFGYPLITNFGKMLYDITKQGRRDDDPAVEIVKAHVDAMREVFRLQIKGDGGDIGRQLLDTLKKAIAKFSNGIEQAV